MDIFGIFGKKWLKVELQNMTESPPVGSEEEKVFHEGILLRKSLKESKGHVYFKRI